MKTKVCTYTVKENHSFNWGGKGPFTLTEVIKQVRELGVPLWQCVEDLIPSEGGWDPFAPREYKNIVNFVNLDHVRWDEQTKIKWEDRKIKNKILDYSNRMIDNYFLQSLERTRKCPLGAAFEMNREFFDSPIFNFMLYTDVLRDTEYDTIVLETSLKHFVKEGLEEEMAKYSEALYDDYYHGGCNFGDWSVLRPLDDDTDPDDE